MKEIIEEISVVDFGCFPYTIHKNITNCIHTLTDVFFVCCSSHSQLDQLVSSDRHGAMIVQYPKICECSLLFYHLYLTCK